jgi:hypothetical protein
LYGLRRPLKRNRSTLKARVAQRRRLLRELHLWQKLVKND